MRRDDDDDDENSVRVEGTAGSSAASMLSLSFFCCLGSVNDGKWRKSIVFARSPIYGSCLDVAQYIDESVDTMFTRIDSSVDVDLSLSPLIELRR